MVKRLWGYYRNKFQQHVGANILLTSFSSGHVDIWIQTTTIHSSRYFVKSKTFPRKEKRGHHHSGGRCRLRGCSFRKLVTDTQHMRITSVSDLGSRLCWARFLGMLGDFGFILNVSEPLLALLEVDNNAYSKVRVGIKWYSIQVGHSGRTHHLPTFSPAKSVPRVARACCWCLFLCMLLQFQKCVLSLESGDMLAPS